MGLVLKVAWRGGESKLSNRADDIHSLLKQNAIVGEQEAGIDRRAADLNLMRDHHASHTQLHCAEHSTGCAHHPFAYRPLLVTSPVRFLSSGSPKPLRHTYCGHRRPKLEYTFLFELLPRFTQSTIPRSTINPSRLWIENAGPTVGRDPSPSNGCSRSQPLKAWQPVAVLGTDTVRHAVYRPAW